MFNKFWLVVIASIFIIFPTFGEMSKVYIIKTSDRSAGLEKLWRAISVPDLTGKTVVIKPNFNSDDPFPATTHLDTLEFVIKKMKDKNPKAMVLAERSGMGDTEEILKNRGVYALAEKYGVQVINLDKLPKDRWFLINEKGNHWKFGFWVAKIFREADYVVEIPCLKTHRFGGDFTLSLKNHIGSIAKWSPNGLYNYMWELHTSRNQRLMIAEVNKYIPTHLIIMDGMQAFISEGPEKGKRVEPGLLLASDDRVAIDAVGVAVLRIYGTATRIAKGKIFDLDQIKRAAELKIGANSPAAIEIIPVNAESQEIIGRIKQTLIQ